MRPFPKCRMTQYPDLEGWSVYKTGLGLRATPAMTAVGATALKLMLGGDEVPGPWADGCANDVVLSTELVNGTGAMPDDLLRLVPNAMKDSSAGLMMLYHLNSRVCAISEAAIAMQEEEFRAQKPILEHKRHMGWCQNTLTSWPKSPPRVPRRHGNLWLAVTP